MVGLAIVWARNDCLAASMEASKDPAMKQALLDYNREDCEALELWRTDWSNCIARRPLTAGRRRAKWSSRPT